MQSSVPHIVYPQRHVAGAYMCGYLEVLLFSAEARAISKATGSSFGLSGRRSEVRKLNMSGGERMLRRKCRK